MELKTWPAKTNAPPLRACPGTDGRNDQIKHAHAGSRRRDVSEPLAQKVSGSWVHTELGLWTVKLGRGVKVEESNKHEVGAENGKPPPPSPRPNCTLSNLIKEKKIVHRQKSWRLGSSNSSFVFHFLLLLLLLSLFLVCFVLFLQPLPKCPKNESHKHLIVRINIFPVFICSQISLLSCCNSMVIQYQ